MRPNRPAIGSLLIALLVVAGMAVPAMAHSPSIAQSDASTAADAMALQTAAQNNSSVNVTVGRQLATVITVSSDDVQSEFQDTAFELSVERGDDEARAEAIADRADELRDRAEAIREDYRAATDAFEDGEISRSEYARQLASLNARASNLASSYELLSDRSQRVSALELRAAGANLTSLERSLEDLSGVSGPGTSALLAQFLGEADGEIELETAGGLKIEIEREGGEFSREFERPRDDDMNITVAHATALQTARDALSTPEEGRWVLEESKVKTLEGAYEFEFRLSGASNLTGEAEVRVDGSTGEIYRLELETERLGDEDGPGSEGDADEDGDELTIVVVEGTPEPNGTITVRVLGDAGPVEGVRVALNERAVGTTDANGTIVVTLPDAAEVELTAEVGESEGELEFEFDDEAGDDRVFEKLDVAASLDDGTVTVAVRFDGEPVRNVTVEANDERVGTTDPAGIVTFAFDAAAQEELELVVVKGAFEAELEYEVRDGTLVLTEEEHERDGEEAEGEEDDEDRETEDAVDALTMSVVDGTPAPGATVTIELLADGASVEGVTVTVNGEVAGTTGADGTLTVTLPMEDSVDIRAEHGDADTRLEFEFDYEEPEETDTDDEEA